MKLITHDKQTIDSHVGSAIAGLRLKEIRLSGKDIQALLNAQRDHPERVTDLLSNWYIHFGPEDAQ